MKTFILDSVTAVFSTIAGIVPTVLSVVTIVVVGAIVARVVTQMIQRLLKEIHVDQLTHKIGLDGILHKGGIKRTCVDLISSLIHWTIMITVLVMGVKSMGLTVVDDVIARLFSYIPHVISAITALVLGMVTANFVATVVKLVAHYTGMPKPELLGMYSKWAIVTFAGMIFLEEIGLGSLLVGTPFQYLFGALCLALALSFGLGGRDAAARTIEKLRK